jgi:hypothetical protein
MSIAPETLKPTPIELIEKMDGMDCRVPIAANPAATPAWMKDEMARMAKIKASREAN